MSGAGNGTEIAGRIDTKLEKMKQCRKNLSDALGFKMQSIKDWEVRGTVLKADVAIRIADYLKVSVRWLVLGEEEPAVKENLTSEEMELLGFWKELTPEQRNTVLVMVRALAGEKSAPEAESAVDSPVQTA